MFQKKERKKKNMIFFIKNKKNQTGDGIFHLEVGAFEK